MFQPLPITGQYNRQEQTGADIFRWRQQLLSQTSSCSDSLQPPKKMMLAAKVQQWKERTHKNKGWWGCDQVLLTSVTATKILTRTWTESPAMMALPPARLYCHTASQGFYGQWTQRSMESSMHLINTGSHWSLGGVTKINATSGY